MWGRVALVVLVGCRAGLAPGMVHRSEDGEVTSGWQVEGGACFPQHREGLLRGAGAFASLSSMRPVGETEGHTGWYWFLVDARLRRSFARGETFAPYWMVGGSVGDGSRGMAGGSVAEVGLEVPIGRASFDVGLRHRFLVTQDDGYLNWVQLGLSLGFSTLGQ